MSYMASHNNVRLVRGSARNYACVDCGQEAKEWAYITGSPGELVDSQGRRYSKDPDHYQPMCFHCHRIMDKASITHCPQGHPYAGENLIYDAGKRKCRTCVYARNAARRRANPLTDDQRARKTELQRQRRASRKQGAA